MQIVLPENASHIIICTNENEAAEVINKGINKKGRRVARHQLKNPLLMVRLFF